MKKRLIILALGTIITFTGCFGINNGTSDDVLVTSENHEEASIEAPTEAPTKAPIQASDNQSEGNEPSFKPEYKFEDSGEDFGEQKETDENTLDTHYTVSLDNGVTLSFDINGSSTYKDKNKGTSQDANKTVSTPTPKPEKEVSLKDELKQNAHKDFDAEYGLFVTYDAGYTKYALYGFDKNVTRGSVVTNNLRGTSVTSVNYEAYYGTTAYVDGTTVYIKAYNHSKEHPIVGSIIKSDNSSRAISISYDEYTAIDCADFADGLYIVSTAFDTANNTIDCYIYVANNGVWLARVYDKVNSFDMMIGTYNETMQALDDANIQPEDCLYIDDIVYPCPDYNENHRCDTDMYIELSHEICDGHDWSDEFKVFALTNWFLQNISYDSWRIRNGCSRAMEYSVWDGTYSMWDMHVGVCCDFSNAMVIMLREQGIPCTSFESTGHMWNVVYLDGHWVPLDITPMLSMYTNAEDGHVTSNLKYNYNTYLSYYALQDEIVSVGADIWTLARHNAS